MVSDFICYRDNLKIRGRQYIPEHADGQKLEAVIACHGFTGNYTSMEDYCRALSEEGYAAFCFNFCGGGRKEEPDNIKSDGDSRDMCLTSEVHDLEAVISYVRGLFYIDAERIILLGASQGGYVAGLTAAENSSVYRLIMLYPALCIPDHARRGRLGGAHYDVNHVPEEIDCGKTVIGRQFHEDVVRRDPNLDLSSFKGDVLLIHGMADKTVEYSYSIRASESYEKGQCHLQLVQDMGHSPDDKQKASIIASIRQFLCGRKEVMCFRIILTHRESESEGEKTVKKIFFTGYCDSDYYKGTILPGGVDRQTYVGNERTDICAEYEFDGVDSSGERCRLSVINRFGEKDWEPKITTDSSTLKWMNDTSFTAVIEHGKVGPVIRVFM